MSKIVKITVAGSGDLPYEQETALRVALATVYKNTLGLDAFVGDVEIVDCLQKIVDQPKEVAEPTVKFELLADLGYITVPQDYDHATCLAVFKKNNREKFYGYNDNITDANFSNPTRILKPGDKIRIRAFKQVVPGTTTSEERMDFLHKQKGNVFVGAQGALHAFEQKRDQLPKGYWYASFDEKDRLWYSGDFRRVPNVHAYSDGGFHWRLGYFGVVWSDGYAFFSFCDESLEA